jgi:hypothetical protein
MFTQHPCGRAYIVAGVQSCNSRCGGALRVPAPRLVVAWNVLAVDEKLFGGPDLG